MRTWRTLRRSADDLPVPEAKEDSSTVSLPVVLASGGRLRTQADTISLWLSTIHRHNAAACPAAEASA